MAGNTLRQLRLIISFKTSMQRSHLINYTLCLILRLAVAAAHFSLRLFSHVWTKMMPSIQINKADLNNYLSKKNYIYIYIYIVPGSTVLICIFTFCFCKYHWFVIPFTKTSPSLRQVSLFKLEIYCLDCYGISSNQYRHGELKNSISLIST